MNKFLDALKSSDICDLYQRDDGPEIILGHVRYVRDSFHGDATTEAGRKAIKSMARKIASFKVRCDNERKEMVGKWKAQIKSIDQRGKYLRDELDAIRDEIRDPVTQFEDRERDRVNVLKDRVAVFLWAESNAQTMDLVELREYIATLDAIDTTTEDWQEFGEQAREAKAAVMPKIKAMLEAACSAECDRIGLERLRAEQAEVKRQQEIAAQEWAEAKVEPSAPEHDLDQIRDDILQDIVCLSAEQIVDKILAGDVRHVRVDL